MTQSFNDILNDLRSTLPPTSPLEPIILQSILACLIARDKHLILHTVSEDVRLVARLAVWVNFCVLRTTHCFTDTKTFRHFRLFWVFLLTN